MLPTAHCPLPTLCWKVRNRTFALGSKPLVMGVVNVTPDSFSDGGRWLDTSAAVEHALRLVAQGADILDVGGESTRPGATTVDVKEELARVVPVVRALSAWGPRWHASASPPGRP